LATVFCAKVLLVIVTSNKAIRLRIIKANLGNNLITKIQFYVCEQCPACGEG
jgi:hypothetical protein